MINLPDGRQILDDPYYLIVEKRILTISLILGILIAGGGLFMASLRLVYSFLAGSAISVLNFYWMKQALDRMLKSFAVPQNPEPPRAKGVIFKYFIRYALIGGILYAIFRYKIFDLQAAVLGLFLVVMAVLYECLHQVVKSIVEDWKRGRA